jgi:hypothetical protein
MKSSRRKVVGMTQDTSGCDCNTADQLQKIN